MQKKNREKRGITLVALVITVIILLILAGVSIAQITNSGLFSKTQEAVEKSKQAKIKEEVALLLTEWNLDSYTDNTSLEGRQVTTESGATVSYSGGEVTYTTANGETYTIRIDENGAMGEVEEQNETNIQAYKSRHPEQHIPTGFTHTTGTASTGYVISDGTNEFVWIPVPDEASYTKQLGTNNWNVKSGSSGADTASSLDNNVANAVRGDTLGVSKILDTNVTSTLDANSPEKAVVYNAGGFWVGRYEAGIASTAREGNLISDISDAGFSDSGKATTSNTFWDSQTIIVAKGVEPARLITQVESLKIANNWKSGNADETTGTVKFQSGLITGAQWDAMCKFIDWNTCNTYCGAWGNYIDVASASGYSGLRSDGENNTWKSGLGQKTVSTYSIFPTGIFTGTSVTSTAKKNIYDVAGNIWEWTTEIPQYSANNAVIRGGGANVYGTLNFATYRGGDNSASVFAKWVVGMRLVLYVQ